MQKSSADVQVGDDADELRRSARLLLAEGESTNTRRSYRSALRYWSAWHEARIGRTLVLPLDVATAARFVVDHAGRRSDGQAGPGGMPPDIDATLVARGIKARPGPPALSTLLHRLGVMSKAHDAAGLPNPLHDAGLRELVLRTRRAHARRGEACRRAPALTRAPLEAILATCDDSNRGVRDRALLLFAWASGGRRRSEVASATLESVQRSGPRAFVHRMGASKTRPLARVGDDGRDDRPVVGIAADALERWLGRLADAGISSGALFRRVRRGGAIGEGLAAAAVREIVVARGALAGLPAGLSAHSLRSGFVTEAARRGVPLGETMALTGHRSVTSVIGYFRAAAALDSPAARLLDDPESDEAASRAASSDAAD